MIRFYKIIILLSTLLFSFNTFSQIVINEYSCANSNTVLDSYGENEDWIELYNTSGVAIDLNGYHLSDKFGNITKFQIPSSISVPANGYLMIFCNGRETINGGQIHTNFKLTQTKNEKIILTNAGALVDSLTIVRTQNNHSRGRISDGSATWSLFTSPTPNISNSGAVSEYATTPNLSVGAGFYNSAQSITITTPDANVTIRYTTDGSEPTAVSLAYSGTINIATTSVLRAKAFSSVAGIPPSFIETNTYFINSPHTVPVVSVCGDELFGLVNDTDPGAFSDDFVGAIEYFDASGSMKTEGQGDFNKHGNDSWDYDQRGVDFIMRDQYGYNYALKEQLFGNKSRDRFQRIMLKAGASDNYPFEGSANANYPGELGGIHLRDPYVHALSQDGDLHLDERTHQSCVVYVNGQYWGVYDLREKVDDSDFTDFYYGQDELWSGSPNNIQFLKTWGWTWEKYGAPNAQNDWDALVNYVQTNNMAVQANFDYVTSQYKWKSLVDYFVLNSYIVSHDMLNYNTAWWRGLDTNGTKKKWRYTLWDMDATFNHYTNYTNIPNTGSTADPCDIDNLPDPGGQGHTTILNALLDNPTFEQYYISRYIDLSNTTFKCTNMISVLDSLVNIITPEMPGQIARWGGTMAEWNQNVQDMRDFINARCTDINQGLVDCYNVTGPFPMTYNVFPGGAGDVQINSATPSNYVFNGNYFGNIDILLTATENTGYVFDHWEVFNHTLDSSITNPNNSLQITQGDSVVAHFIIIGDTIGLTFDVDPVGGGDIAINGFTPATYEYSSFYPETSVLSLVASPSAGYTFVNWTSNSTPFNAISTDPNVTITVDQLDTIVAHFSLIDTFNLAFNVNPTGGGDISIDGFIPATYSYSNSYEENTTLNLIATPIIGAVFLNWSSTNGTTFIASPTDPAVSIVVGQHDSIVAHFDVTDTLDIVFNVDPVGSGDISIDGFTPVAYSYSNTYIENTTLNLVATPQVGSTFLNWSSTNGTTFIASPADSAVSIVVGQNDSIVAHFDVIDTLRVVFNVDIPGSGNIAINGVTPASYTYSEEFVENTVVNLTASPLPGYIFVNWSSTNGTSFLASPINPNVNVTIEQADSLVANFILIEFFDIEFKVSPVSMGEVEIYTNTVFSDMTTTSIVKTYMGGTSIVLTETPISNFLFDHWGANFHTLMPSSANTGVSFVVTGHDVITAYYIEEVIPPPKTAQIPDAFSPNGDGNNDVLFVYGGQIEEIALEIYDRWGEKVFTSSSVTDGWDGT
ncbi:CotH kinase family protein, partial [Vicingaceae bacterium]|nr:CotH kinase family protein [Vicingaceae bacterium]